MLDIYLIMHCNAWYVIVGDWRQEFRMTGHSNLVQEAPWKGRFVVGNLPNTLAKILFKVDEKASHKKFMLILLNSNYSNSKFITIDFFRCVESIWATIDRKFITGSWLRNVCCGGNWFDLDWKLACSTFVDIVAANDEVDCSLTDVGVEVTLCVLELAAGFDVDAAIKNCLWISSNDRRSSSFGHLGSSALTILGVSSISSAKSCSTNACSSSNENGFVIEFGPPESELLSSSMIVLGNKRRYSRSIFVHVTCLPLLKTEISFYAK